jgi:DnaJ-class molecular chaperone|uniref:Chaperone protein n=1 Tax=Myoviridae sp. ctLEM34 TaxID=2825082 RepID=A0A8S5TQY0_9CAUD|nr:MAG TPA: chaperone protein [Myoviridae sp. ctLEM34]DAV55151.1 MAG TPA: chaperone protein [Caudoviricetes sp.]
MKREVLKPTRVALCRKCCGSGLLLSKATCPQCEGSGRVLVSCKMLLDIRPYKKNH